MEMGRPTTLWTGCCIGSISTFISHTLTRQGATVNRQAAGRPSVFGIGLTGESLGFSVDLPGNRNCGQGTRSNSEKHGDLPVPSGRLSASPVLSPGQRENGRPLVGLAMRVRDSYGG